MLLRRWVASLALAAAACSEPARTSYVPDAGALDGPAPEAGGRCARDQQCDDRIACTVDHCRDGACTHEPCADCCPAGSECLEESGCGRPRTPCARDAECADSIRCTLDRCRDGRFCEHVPQEGLCEQGSLCLAAVGCVTRPPDRCATDADCNVRRCQGTWSCAPELGCQFRGATSCDDGDPCTADTCTEERGCQHAPRDGDRDGHADRACRGDDCDDADPARHPGAEEVCGNGRDEDCDGMADEGCCAAGVACTTACGSAGVTACPTPGGAATCTPPAETCNGRDDDCDGMTDEGCCATGVPCTTTCGTTGITSCTSPPACTPPAEACNGRDDDCDGMTDEGCCVAGRPCPTACGSTGVTACASPAATATCTPPSEVCNGRDDNCDGRTDESCCTAGQACMTACGSVGSTTCTAMGAPGPCAPPAESCNGRDDDCDGRVDQTFACAPGSVSACVTACGSMSTRTCNPDCSQGPCVPPAETCNGRDDDCDGAADEGFDCAAGSTGPCATACGSTGRRTCRGSCAWDACVPPAETCNGADDNCNAACDEGFTCCARSTRDCTALGFVSGTATCRADCGGWDTSGCSNCGNRVRQGTEQCDGADLGGATCASRGFGGGTLRCRADCTYDTTGCGNCGNGRVDAGEQCDGADLAAQTCATRGFGGGTLRCSSACTFDTSMCAAAFNPTGVWAASPAVAYRCAFGLVNVSFGNLSFNDTGASLSVSGGGLPCVMSGASARASRMVNVTCTAPGSCNETYTLTGTFPADNRFTGTLRAAFSGSCFDCAMQSLTVTASR